MIDYVDVKPKTTLIKRRREETKAEKIIGSICFVAVLLMIIFGLLALSYVDTPKNI